MAWKYSSFMSVKDVRLEIAETMGNMSWIFRPHPLLGTSLVNNGQIKNLEEYESYLNRWRNLPNASVQIGGDYRKMNGCMESEYIYRDIRDAIFWEKDKDFER